MKKEKGKWVCFPTEENWDKETEIDKGIVYFKSEEEEIMGLKERGFLGWLFTGEVFKKNVPTKIRYAGTRNVDGIMTHTEPFCIWQYENGEYNAYKTKEHPLTN